MGYIAKIGHRRGLEAFLTDLLESDSLGADTARLARAALDRGFDGLSQLEQATLETQAIDPYCGECETCGTTPSWAEMLHVYDTGLCSDCFTVLLRDAPESLGPQYLAYRPHAEEDLEDTAAEQTGATAADTGIAATA